MSTLGKVLLGLCLATAIAFLVIAAMDYDKRQAWNYALFRHRLAISGLPLDAKDNPELSRELDNKATLASVFQAAGGEPVLTQEAEVERLKTRLRQEFQLLDEAGKRAFLESHLLPLARTTEQRDAIRSQVRAADANLDELASDAGPLGQAFAVSDPNERRQRVARLLYVLGQARKEKEPNAPLRAQTVLGLTAYVDQANRQAHVQRELGQNVLSASAVDRIDFLTKQRQMFQDVLEKADILRDRRSQLAARQAERTEWQEQVNNRKLLADELNQEIVKQKKAAETALAGQTRKEQELFEAQRKIALAQDQNRALETKIRQLESAR